MSKVYEDMSIDELKETLVVLEEELEDVEDERMMMLGQSGHHISSGRLAARYAGMLEDVKGKIKKVEEMIEAKK